MKSILYLIIAVLPLLGCSKKPQQLSNDLKEYKLKGKVKSIKEISYEAVLKSDNLVLGERKRNIFLDEHDKYISFNIAGNIVEQKFYNSDGGLLDQFRFIYNTKGSVIEELWYDPNKSLGQKRIYKYEFDNSGKLFKKELYNSKDNLIEKETFNYNDLGELITKCLYKSDGSLDDKESYKYDDKGNLTELLNFNSEGTLSTKTLYKYDSIGNILADEWYTPDDLMMVTAFEYTSSGGLALEGVYLPQSDNIELKKSIEYDDKGNWTKRIIIKNGHPSFIVLRDILYYE